MCFVKNKGSERAKLYISTMYALQPKNLFNLWPQ